MYIDAILCFTYIYIFIYCIGYIYILYYIILYPFLTTRVVGSAAQFPPFFQVGRLKKKEKEDAELERMKKALDKSTSKGWPPDPSGKIPPVIRWFSHDFPSMAIRDFPKKARLIGGEGSIYRSKDWRTALNDSLSVYIYIYYIHRCCGSSVWVFLSFRQSDKDLFGFRCSIYLHGDRIFHHSKVLADILEMLQV